MRGLTLLTTILLFFCQPGVEALPPPQELSSLAGEVLEFSIRWGRIPAGVAFLEVIPGDREHLRFRASVNSLPALDYIYPVRDVIESTVRFPEIQAVRFIKETREGWGQPKKDELVFDLKKGTASRFKDGKPRKTLKVPADVQDSLSCFYWYRIQPIKDDAKLSFNVTDGARLVKGSVTIVGRETLVTPAGEFQTIIVEPRMEGIGGIFKKTPGSRLLLWLTDDAWRRPVKLESEISIGKIVVELTKIEQKQV